MRDLDCITFKTLDKIVKLINDDTAFIQYLCMVEHYSMLCYMLKNKSSSITFNLIDGVRESYGLDAATFYTTK